MAYARRAACAVLVVVALAVAAGALLWLQGYRVYAVRTGSMSPTYPTGSLVVDSPAAGSLPRVGDVITFTAGTGLVTHRVHGRSADGVTTKGDANRTPDVWTVGPEHIVGKVAGGISGAGYALVFLRQPAGVPSLLLLGLSVAFAWTLFFPSPGGRLEESGARPGARRRRRGTPAVAGVALVAALASVGLGGHATRPTSAYFSDSVAGTLSVTVTCVDHHTNGNGPKHGNGHDMCRGTGHVTNP